MCEYKIPVSLLSDFRISRIEARFGTKGFGAVVKLMLYLAAQSDCRIEMLSDMERELAGYCGVSHGLMSDIISYGVKLGLFRLKDADAGFYLACSIFENPTSKKDENEQPLFKVTQNPEKESEIGQILISEGKEEVACATGKKEKKKQKKKEDINNINLLNKLPYGESKVVYLTDAEYKKLVQKFGAAKTQQWIEKLESYIHVFPDKAKGYASHYHVILTWDRRDERKKRNEPSHAFLTGQPPPGYTHIRRLDE